MKSRNGSVKLAYFPGGSCLGMELQESLEEGYKADHPTDDGGIHLDYCQTLHNLLSTYYEDVLSVKGASGVSVPRNKCRRQGRSKFVASILHYPLLWRPLRRRAPACGPRDGDPTEGGQVARGCTNGKT